MKHPIPARHIPIDLTQDTNEPIKLITRRQMLCRWATMELMIALDVIAVIIVNAALIASAVVAGLVFGIIACCFTRNMGFKSSIAFTFLSSDMITSKLQGKTGYLEAYYKRYLSKRT